MRPFRDKKREGPTRRSRFPVMTDSNSMGSMDRGRVGRRAVAGFTLVEAILVVAVGGILLAIAVPNLRTFIQNNRISSASTDFLFAVSSARSEAAKLGLPVVMCRSDDPGAASPVCSGNPGVAWTGGWIMFNDCNGDGVPNIDPADTVCIGNTPETLLQAATAAPKGVTINADPDGGSSLTFRGDGSVGTVNDGEVRYAICDDRDVPYGDLVKITGAGAASICSLKDEIEVPGSCPGGGDPCNAPS